MNRALKLTAALLLSLSLGLHWVVLQSFAWTTMLIERTQTTSFATALKTTFDGQHPCKICRVVREGHAAEKKPESQLKLQKLEIAAPREIIALLTAPEKSVPVIAVCARWSARSDAPAPPPPRTV